MVNVSTEIRSKCYGRSKFSIVLLSILVVLYIRNSNENLNRYNSYYDVGTLVETVTTTMTAASSTTTTTSSSTTTPGERTDPRVIDRSEANFPKEQVQMCWEQVQYILQHLPENGNLLIWGLGYDSIYWNTVTTGRVVFLEDGDMNTNLVPNLNPVTANKNKKVRWYDSITDQYPQLQAYTVNYSTQNTKSQLKHYKENKDIWEEQLYIHELPEMVLSTTTWDVIIVDAPLGYPRTGPGRFQSLYMTKVIAARTLNALLTQQPTSSAVVHVFVDDYERDVERDFSLAVFHPVVPERVTPRPPYKEHVTPNEQAHFIISLSNMS